jgi:hypothetical protein
MLQNDMSQSHKKINLKKTNKHFNLNKYTLYYAKNYGLGIKI